jgi:CelD/BcsL family acetyltransferase involved in cellulose biosynthesis
MQTTSPMNQSNLQISTIASLDEGLRVEWNRLAGPKVFRRFEWAQSWLETFGVDCEPHVALVRTAGGELVGVAPFCLRRMSSSTTALEIIGGGKACGDDLSILAGDSWTEPVGRVIADWLLEDRGAGHWDELWMSGVSEAEPGVAVLGDHFAKSSCDMLRISDQSRWACQLPSTLENYLSRLGKSSRRLARQVLKRLDHEPQTFSLDIAHDDDSRQELLAQAARLHELRWESSRGGGCFAHQHFAPFVEDVTRQWLEEGMLRLAVLKIANVPAAAAIGVLNAGVLSIYLTGRDPRFDDRHAGWMLNFALVRLAIESGVHTVDMLRGDEEYKQRLGGRPTPQFTYFTPGHGLRNQIRGLSYSGRERLRQWRRRIV